MQRILATCLAAFAILSASAVAGTVGWRGDGSGRFPEAKPPVEWERRSESIIQLRSQAGKPKEGDSGTPIADGVIREWLVLGPLPLPEGLKDFKQEIIPGEVALEPVENDSHGDLKWVKVSVDNSCLDFKRLFGPEKVEEGSPPLVAYAHAWIRSEAVQSVLGPGMAYGKHTATWLNGKPLTGKIALDKGWNHLVCRAVSNPGPEKKNNSWYIRLALFGEAGGAYRTRNIAWTTPMPGQGYGGPVIVGDRIFVTADMSNLLCVDKKSGDVLWIASNTCYDALPEDKRKDDSPGLKAAGELHVRLQELNRQCVGKPALTAKFIDEKIKLEGDIHKGMKDAYDQAGSLLMRVFGCEVGSAAMTPVSDGRCMYALFGNCVLACYDLDGKRKWITMTPRDSGEHGHTSSPIIVGDKVIASLSGVMIAFDKETGKLLWETSTVYRKESITYCKFYGTPCVFSQEGQEYIFTSRGQLIRASDGKSLYFELFKAGGGHCPSPVVSADRIYMNAKSLKFPAINDQDIKPEIASLAELNELRFPAFYVGGQMASPLLHEGLMYCPSTGCCP